MASTSYPNISMAVYLSPSHNQFSGSILILRVAAHLGSVKEEVFGVWRYKNVRSSALAG